LGRKKKTENIKLLMEPKNSEYDVTLHEVGTDLKQVTKDWSRGFSLSAEELVESCYQKYERIFNHNPTEGWLFIDSQGIRTLYLKLEKGDK
jgi:cell division protein YceG involved in septum cleavage